MKFADHFTYGKIIRCTFPTVIMMIFTSLYGVVDGLFLSNFAGKDAFAAVSFIMPYLMMFNSVGFMFGTGGSALIARKLGEGRDREANEIFSSLVLVSGLTGITLAALGMAFLRPAAMMQGAEGALLENSLRYGRIYFLGTPACMIQFEFESLYSASGKNKMGLFATVVSGIMNVVLDAVFLGVFSWGLEGAAFATIISQWTGGIIPFVYFGRKNKSMLRLVRCRPRMRDMLRICINGSSEMVNNISVSVVNLLYNVQLLSWAGDDGVAAYGIMMYVNFMFTAVFWGYMTGVSPIISFQYGAANHEELHNLLKRSLTLIISFSGIVFLLSELMAEPISSVFVSYDGGLMAMTAHGFRLFAVSFLFAGMSIFWSGFFTALNNGIISALISFSRVFLFQIPAILLLPLVLKLDGIWLAVVAAEVLTTVMGTVICLKYKKRYNY